ncbi:reverse transcriptase-5 [Lasius niger]|uniref:Reverse transcriptase-5 n=1 Tax=Lasius niger TaxID=67767 RepID=A0A0J7MW39_LASNI|nr:reverse transcriptase-5 [Lasius niger]
MEKKDRGREVKVEEGYGEEVGRIKGVAGSGKSEGKNTNRGDFNARTGEEGRWAEEEEQGKEKEGRKSKDKRINGEERRLSL